MESAGPRQTLFFDPAKLACGIVTCGGLCPGLNDVIRAIVRSLRLHYGVNKIYGFRFGYEGLVRRMGHEPLESDARIRPPDPRERRIDPRIVPRASGPGGNGRLPERTGGRDPLRHRRRRDASRRAEDRRGSGAAWPEDRRHRCPEDDRQRHLVRAENLWIRDGRHRGAARDVCGQRRGGSGAQRDRTREADGPRFGIHRGVFGPGQQPRELLPDSRGAVHARQVPVSAAASGSSAEATR